MLWHWGGYSCERFSLAWPGPRGLIKGINVVNNLSDSQTQLDRMYSSSTYIYTLTRTHLNKLPTLTRANFSSISHTCKLTNAYTNTHTNSNINTTRPSLVPCCPLSTNMPFSLSLLKYWPAERHPADCESCFCSATVSDYTMLAKNQRDVKLPSSETPLQPPGTNQQPSPWSTVWPQPQLLWRRPTGR